MGINSRGYFKAKPFISGFYFDLFYPVEKTMML